MILTYSDGDGDDGEADMMVTMMMLTYNEEDFNW